MRVHTTWLKGRIQSITQLTTKTFVTIAQLPDPDDDGQVLPPYVVIHPMDGTDDSDRLAGPSVTKNPRWVIHSVGLTSDQAAWAGEQVKKTLIVAGRGVIPVITGEIAGEVWYSSPTPIQLDKDVSPPLRIHIAECGFSTDPA